jgi:hypothetical protein
MRVDQFDFVLPQELIALRPVSPRDASRLLVVRKTAVARAVIRDLPICCARGVLVVNDSKVILARLGGRRLARGPASARISRSLHGASPSSYGFVRPAKRVREQDRLQPRRWRPPWSCRGEIELAFDRAGAELDAAIASEGGMPLPPARRQTGPDARDRTDYQTIYAAELVPRADGRASFSPDAWRSAAAGRWPQTITLHVGAGTFLPVTAATPGIPHARRHADSRPRRRKLSTPLGGRRTHRCGKGTAARTSNARRVRMARSNRSAAIPFHHRAIASRRWMCFTNSICRARLFMLVCAFLYRTDEGGLCERYRGTLPLLFLWRCVSSI